MLGGQYNDAVRCFCNALALYKRGKSRNILPKEIGVPLIGNILRAIEKRNPAQFEEDARNELADPLYDELEEEFALLALKEPGFAPTIRERKQAAPTTSPGESGPGTHTSPPNRPESK